MKLPLFDILHPAASSPVGLNILLIVLLSDILSLFPL